MGMTVQEALAMRKGQTQTSASPEGIYTGRLTVEQALAMRRPEQQASQNVNTSGAGNLSGLLRDYQTGYDKLAGDYQTRFQGRSGSYKDDYLADTSAWKDAYKTEREALQGTRKQIERILNDANDWLDPKTRAQMRTALYEMDKYLDHMGEGYTKTAEFFGEFENEDAYKKWQDAAFHTGEQYYQDRLDWYEDATKRVVTLTGAEKEELEAKIARYERGEGEWATYDVDENGEGTGLQTGFRNLESDRNLAKLQDQKFMDGAKQEAEMAYIPSFEELSQMDALIYDNNMVMDIDENGQVVAYSSVDGSRLIQDKDGNFHHAMENDPKYTSIDRLGVYLSADSDQKAKTSVHGAISTWDNIRNQGIASHWDFLTAEEVSIYYGLKASSQEEADAYLQGMQSTLNHRYENARALGTAEEYENGSWLHRARMQGRGIIVQGLSGIGHVVVMVDSAINDKEIDAYSGTYSGTRYTNAVRGAEARILEKQLPGEFLGLTAGDVYQAVMSAVDSAIYNTIPVIGTAITAASGSANDVVDKYAQGASQNQMLRSAATTFAIELATESMGVDKLKMLEARDVYTWTDWIVNVLKQGGSELGEEVISYLGNNVADLFNRRSQAEWSQIVNRYKDNPAAAVGEILGQLMKDGLSGFIAGVLGGGFGTIKNTKANTRKTRNIGSAIKTAKGGVEGIKTIGTDVAKVGNNKGLGRFVSRLNENSSDARVGKAYRLTDAAVREQNKAELAQVLQEKGYSKKQAQQIAEAAVSSAVGWRLTEKQQSIWSAAQQDPDVASAVKEALTGEESSVRQRNQRMHDFRSGVSSGNAKNSQADVKAQEDALGVELRRQLRASGIPVAEEMSMEIDGGKPSVASSTEQAANEDYSPEMREAMQEAFVEGEITEEEYDDYMDALLEQEGLEGLTEEEQLIREKAEAVERQQLRAQQQATQQENKSFNDLLMEQMGMGQEMTTPQSATQTAPLTRGAVGADARTMTQDDGGTDNGAGVLHGSGQRNDRASAGEPAGSMAGRAGSAAQRSGSAVDRIRKTNERRALGKNLRLEKVSSASLGVESGTDNANLQVIPEEHWDVGMRAKAEQVYEETGKRVTYVLGSIQITNRRGGVSNVRGVITDGGIVVRADHAKYTAEQIADHESYHGMADYWQKGDLDGQIAKLIKESFTKEEFDKVMDNYILALRETIDVEGALTGEERAKRLKQVQQEILADAYAGINAFGAGATKYTETVRSYLRDNYISREGSLDSSTEQPTGPPAQSRTFQEELDAQMGGEPGEQKENTAEHGGERYSLIVKHSNGIEKLEDPTQITREKTLEYLKLARKGRLEEHTYFPVASHTPMIIINSLWEAGVEIVDKPLAMQARKAKQAQTNHDIHTKDGFAVRGHAMAAEEVLEAIEKLDSPEVIIHETERKGFKRIDGENVIKELPDAFVVFVTLDSGKECVAVIEFDSTIDPSYIENDGKGEEYHTTITIFEPDVSRKGIPYNYFEYLCSKKENRVIEITNESPNSRTVHGENLTTVSEKELSSETVPHRIAEVKQQIKAVLDGTSVNHAAQMESYTKNKDSDPELAQKLYDGLMDSPYAKQFEEYLKLTEELERLEKESSSPMSPQNDGGTGNQFVERASLDDSVSDDGERIATPEEPARNDSGNREQTNEAEEQKDSYSTLPAKARDYVRSAERNLLEFVGEALSVPKTAQRDFLAPIVRTITNEYLENGRVSQETVDALFQRAYAEGIVADEEYYRQYEHIKKHLHDTAVTLAERDRSDIADFTDFRRQAGGLLKIRNEGGLPVDVAYQELQDMAPELFPDHITHPADQLVHMLEVAKGIEVAYYSLNQYYGNDAAGFKQDARYEFENAVDKVVSKLHDAKRYMEEKNAEKEKAPATVEEAMEAWKQLKEARKIYEKAMAKNLLTEHDQQIVGDLLYGGRTLESLDPKTDNIKGIEAVYEAKKEYARLVGLLTEYKRNMKAKLRSEADGLLETANEWKDKGSGLAYSRETMRRNVLDIVKDPEVADKILRKYFEPVAVGEAAATRFKDKYRETVEELELSRKVKKGDTVSEAHAVQLLGEAMDNIAMIESSRGRVKDRDGKNLTEWKAVVQELWETSPSLDKAKIEGAVQKFREIYDELFQQMNEVRVRNGYEPVNYRRGYFPHFQKESADGILSHFGRALGISTEVAALPTTINGLTHTFRPGIQWFGNALSRTGFGTAYDAVEGFDKYIEGVASVIHQTDNIQRLRALASQIRYRTSDEGVRKQVDDVLKDNRLSEEEKQAKINGIYQEGRFALSNFIVELDDYTNILANKKSRRDRNTESNWGRRFYNVAKWLEQRIAANMIAGNLSSALTNFIPLTQATARMDRGYLLRGMWNTLKAYKQDDGMVETSTFLTNRRGSDPLVRTWQDEVSSWVGMPMELIDKFVADSIVRGAYYQNLNKGMTEDEALHQADLFAASVMADRSKGAMPTLFAARNFWTKLFTMFQLEVNNQFSEIFKDIPREMRGKSKTALAMKLLQYVLGAFCFNELFEWIFGRRPALDPIGILNEAVGDFSGYELPNLLELGVGAITGNAPSFKTEKQGVGQGLMNLGENILGELPFSSALGLVGIGEDNRIPVESALPDVKKLIDAASKSEWAPRKRWKTAGDELAKPLTYLALPFGGNQVSKIVKGVIATVQGGSYTVDNEGNDILQYPVYDDPWSAIRAAVMGKSALPTAQDWVDSGFDSFSAEETAVYQGVLDVGVDDREAYAFVDEMRNAKKTETESKADVQRRIIMDSDVSAEAKVVAYCGMVATDTELEWLDRLLELDPDAQDVIDVAIGLMAASELKGDAVRRARADAIAGTGMSEAQKIVAVESFLGTEWLTEKGNPTEYALFRDALEVGLTVDDYMELYAEGVNMERFFKYTDAGLSVTEAVDALIGREALAPKEGADKVSTTQKWRAAVDSQDNPGDQLAALSVEMTENQHMRATVANNYGVTPTKYVGFRELLPDYDEDGNKSYSQKEVTAAIDAVAGKLGLTKEQKAVLWQLTVSSDSAKNNPYSTEIGWKVVEALGKTAQSGGGESLSFNDLLMKQIFGNA